MSEPTLNGKGRRESLLVKEAAYDLAVWALSGDTGSSSKTLAKCLLSGDVPRPAYYPHDAGDLGRCIRLIEKVPLVRGVLPYVQKSGPEWEALIENWDVLAQLYRAELPRGTFPLTNRAIDGLINRARRNHE